METNLIEVEANIEVKQINCTTFWGLDDLQDHKERLYGPCFFYKLVFTFLKI